MDTAPIRKGSPLVCLGAWAYWYDRNVEEINSPVWGWSLTNDVLGQPGRNNGSNHLSAVALDILAPRYPFGRLVMPAAKVAKVEEGLRLFSPTGRIEDSVIKWGRDWSKPDEMHYQMRFPEGDKRNDEMAAKLLGGYLGIYKAAPAGESVDVARVLGDVMGNVSGVRYASFVDAVAQCLRDSECNSVKRIAMWVSQISVESMGLKYMEEIASGAAYEGRCSDLGNCSPGDGVKYKGRGPIQVTGKGHYAALSKWAHARGLVPTPTFFVDNPSQLATPTYGFMGTTWYWLTHKRKDDQDGIPKLMNQYADEGDIEGGTKCVNGGLTHIDDRRASYQRALAMGDKLLSLLQGDDDPLSDPAIVKMITELHACLLGNKVPSQSRYATEGEGDRWRLHELIKNDDGMVHESYVERLAILGDPTNVALVARNAVRTGDKTDPLAQSVFLRIDDKFLTDAQRALKNTLIVARFGSDTTGSA